MKVELSVASEGGSGTTVPDISIEVDDLEEALARIKKAKIPVEYGPKTEPWGVRRFYVRDPGALAVRCSAGFSRLLRCSASVSAGVLGDKLRRRHEFDRLNQIERSLWTNDPKVYQDSL